MLFGAGQGTDTRTTPALELFDHLLDQDLRCRGAGRETKLLHPFEPVTLDVVRPVDQVGGRSKVNRDFPQPIGVRAVG